MLGLRKQTKGAISSSKFNPTRGIVGPKMMFRFADLSGDGVFNQAGAPIDQRPRPRPRAPSPGKAPYTQLQENNRQKDFLNPGHQFPFLLIQVVTRFTLRSTIGGNSRLPATISARPSLFRSPQATVIKPIGEESIGHILKF